MEYREYRGFTEPGYIANKPQLEVLTLEISYAHVMKCTLEAGFRNPEQEAQWDEDDRDLPDGFLHAVIQRVFAAAGDSIDEAFEEAIEDAAEEWGLTKREADHAD